MREGVWLYRGREYPGKYEYVWHKSRFWVSLSNGKSGWGGYDEPDFGHYKYKRKSLSQESRK